LRIALAVNRQDYHLVIVAEQAGDIEATLAALSRLIALDEADRRHLIREARRRHSFLPVVIRPNLTWDEMARIEVAVPELPGVSVEQGLTRHYPLGETAAHAVGYVAAVSERELTGDPLLEPPDFHIGKSGIEKSEDLPLRGAAGTRQVEVNAFGRVVRELARIEGEPGQDIVIGLDAAMQDFVSRRCSGEQSVACVLLDVASGEVLALVGFAPVGAPRYACATVVEHGGEGSAAAAPICSDVLRAVQQRDPARRVPVDDMALAPQSPRYLPRIHLARWTSKLWQISLPSLDATSRNSPNGFAASVAA
jgi:cell division protein FtsI/penicillin-binding protein 2